MTLKIKKTFASIWLQISPNNYKGVFLYNFPELFHTGFLLLTEYCDINKVTQLIELGHLLELKEFPIHNDEYPNYCTISVHNKYQDPIEHIFSNSILGTKKAPYSYLFKDNQWFINLAENYQLLTHEIIEDSISNPIVFYEQQY